MKRIFWISGIKPMGATAQAHIALSRIYPEGIDEFGWWDMKLEDVDPRTQACIDCLSMHGFHPWTDHTRERIRSVEYTLEILRHYDDSDLQACRLLWLWAAPLAYCHPRRRDGCIRIELPGEDDRDNRFDPHADIHATGQNQSWVIVSDRVKRIIEAGGMRHVAFTQTFVIPPPPPGEWNQDEEACEPWDDFGEAWWELTSDLILPRMSQRAIVRNRKGVRITDDFSEGCMLKEGINNIDALITPPEPKYREADINALGEFDLARSFEAFGHVWHDSGRLPIVSNRFYRLCREHKIKVSFVPVRVHE